ncbi:MAG: proline dehydrogenase family protein [Chloroflexi bacterium]|nr:proline dehydrogenase family protein [Chloroflexota bacterium]
MPILRDLFLAMSTNSVIRNFVIHFPLSRRVTRRFVAGETLDEAIAVVKKLNKEGLLVTFDQLGESVTNAAEARQAKDGYLRALDAIAANKVKSQVSLKLTQMGLDLSTDLCLDNLRQVLRKAKEIGTLVTIDMEDSKYTQVTLNVFKTLREEFDNVGIVLQSYLYRSEEDMKALIALGANVRLCKGAYKEPATVAFPKKANVDANYLKLAQIFFETNGNSNGAYLDVASHDEKMINWVKGYTTAHQVNRNRFEFQMLYGIRSDLHRRLVAEGYTMRVYVPYGTHWYPYFMRRLAERPANVIFLISNLFR